MMRTVVNFDLARNSSVVAVATMSTDAMEWTPVGVVLEAEISREPLSSASFMPSHSLMADMMLATSVNLSSSTYMMQTQTSGLHIRTESKFRNARAGLTVKGKEMK